MAKLFGKSFTRQELERRTGHLSQVAGIRAGELSDGNERGSRILDFRTGSGFVFSVSPDRCMDISFAEFRGTPLCWRSQTGDVHPSFYEPQGIEWLRTFQGGMLATCGLSNLGPESVDGDETYGVHGRIGTAPARNVQWDTEWHGDDCNFWAQGRMQEGRFFGSNLTLTRRISTSLGSNRLQIRDVIRNNAFEPAPMMILYHFNCGFPLLCEEAEVICNSEMTPRDANAEVGVDVWNRGDSPSPGFKEQVHIHQMKQGEDGTSVAALINRSFDGGNGIGLAIRSRPAELPFLWQWRQLGEGAYVMGIEPCNCQSMGRGEARAAGQLPVMDPGEERVHNLELEVLSGVDDIERVIAESEGAG